MAGPAQNFYLGLQLGKDFNPENVVAVSNVSAGPGNGTAADVEVRIQINNGSNATNITRKDVVLALELIKAFIEGNGSAGAGANLPAT